MPAAAGLEREDHVLADGKLGHDAGGFAVLTFSNFGPVWRFGIMTSIAVLGALFTDIFLMPALTGKRSQLEQISEKSDAVVSENAAQKQ